MTEKRALVTGITGQTGSYIADLLVEKGYKVFGLKRRNSSENQYGNAAHLVGKVTFIDGDLNDVSSLLSVITSCKPHEIYNMAAQSHVGVSFSEPIHTAMATGIGVLNLLEAIRKSGLFIKFAQASSSEIFGGQYGQVYLNEKTPINPRSPYGCAKAYGYFITKNYRESYNMFAVNAISFNHESPRRHETFVTRKITKGVANIYHGHQDKLYLGNLDSKRDWSHAADMANGIWLMLQQSDPTDYVLASGETRSIREFCEIAFDYAGLGDYTKYVAVDPKFYRPAEVDILLGDATKAKEKLGWVPKYSFKELVTSMIDNDIAIGKL